MEYLNQIEQYVSISYILTNIISVYLICKIFEKSPKLITLTRNYKQIVTAIMSFIIGFEYIRNGNTTEIIVTSALVSIISYDYLIKHILKLLKIK